MKPSGMLKSSTIAGKAGVTIVLEKGEMKVNKDTRIVTTHFRFCDQFNGFLGSFGPSQVIYNIRKLRMQGGDVEYLR